MSGIIYDNRRVKAYEGLKALGEYTQKSEEWVDSLWEELVLDAALMKEFMYYIDNHKLLDEIKCEGYGLTDKNANVYVNSSFKVIEEKFEGELPNIIYVDEK